ncbi:peptide chain release factor 1 [Deinococcus yavapaiensis]|uniref:Peptide chain release factor 1 n=1 Tax=Deinococcus yavapaiensis KR-236 TaxID=694435 RepID=A0A318S6Q6_9DEIO|nr:peptide chain release factor 1 [Deinococcus yavapaiensis]PYE53397.1 peptide chain release factor 1 (bRF-1) [Deinococcus yavapaiensis KR-236]
MLSDRLADLVHEYQRVERDLSNPDVLTDPARLLSLSRRHSELGRIVSLHDERERLSRARLENLELLTDPEMSELAASDLHTVEARLRDVEAELEVLLLPSDPHDASGAILELRAGAGGDEAALFAADLLRMYGRYAENANLKVTVLDAHESDLGGLKSLVAEVTGEYAFRAFKFERGVHRVQRVPATEAQGRIHTSTVTVAVLAEVEDAEVELDASEVRIDVFRSQGAGGQGVNTTDSAVRAAYRVGTPEEIIVVCQESRSQIKNREKALAILRARLAERARIAREASERAIRQAQVGTGERSEKIRTYNYPQDRVTDHRLAGDDKNFPLARVMAGELAPIVDALLRAERERMLVELASGEATGESSPRGR